jgi:hypothetical protein
MDDLRERYRNDATFHACVDYARRLMREHHMTPVELKDAVLLATFIELERSPTPPAWLSR